MAATNPSAIYNPNTTMQLIDENLYTDTEVLGTSYVPDVTGNVETNYAGDKLVIPIDVEVEGNAGVITNPVNGTVSAYDTNQIDFVEVTIKRGLYNLADDNYSLAKMARLTNPEQWLAERFLKKAKGTIYNEMKSVLDGVAAGYKTDISAEVGSDAYLSLNNGIKKNNKKFFGDKGRQEKALVIINSAPMLDIEGDTTVQTSLQYGSRNDEAAWLGLAGFNWHTNDVVTTSGTGSSTTYNTYMVLPGGLSMYFRIVPELFGDQVRIPGTTAFNTIFAFDYAVFETPGSYNRLGHIKSKASYDAA